MGTKAIDPQTIRNVTIIGEPDATNRIAPRLHRRFTETGSGTIQWTTDRVDHTIHLTELSSRAPLAELERSIRVADGVIAVVHAAERRAPRSQTLLRVADDHQVARMCLVTGLDDVDADFDRSVATIADTRGAVPLTVQIPVGAGTGFGGVIDLVSMWALEPMGVEFFGPHWALAEQRYRDLVATVSAQDARYSGPGAIPPDRLRDRIRGLTRIGEAVPVLCDATPRVDDVTPLLDAIVRYLPSPLHVCQPEHALDY
ncbi:GTP-binding protein [Nocardia spumae]|uniref:GTP-binding protein n=1 Tax=Nocardia spumae TaxID=2887190 RepID=UPI001D13B060|nr:GTP-binding protein [Nocardia spumae]